MSHSQPSAQGMKHYHQIILPYLLTKLQRTYFPCASSWLRESLAKGGLPEGAETFTLHVYLLWSCTPTLAHNVCEGNRQGQKWISWTGKKPSFKPSAN